VAQLEVNIQGLPLDTLKNVPFFWKELIFSDTTGGSLYQDCS